MAILISFGEDESAPPDKDLVALMISKASSYHFVHASTIRLVYDYRWVTAERPEPASYDSKCWHIKEDSNAPQTSHGVEGCQALLEGLHEGWLLARKQLGVPPVKPKALKTKSSRTIPKEV
jgi:hypothetical protein